MFEDAAPPQELRQEQLAANIESFIQLMQPRLNKIKKCIADCVSFFYWSERLIPHTQDEERSIQNTQYEAYDIQNLRNQANALAHSFQIYLTELETLLQQLRELDSPTQDSYDKLIEKIGITILNPSFQDNALTVVDLLLAALETYRKDAAGKDDEDHGNALPPTEAPLNDLVGCELPEETTT